MTLEQVDSLLRENKSLQRKLIKTMAKSRNNQLATILDLISITNSQEQLEKERKEELYLYRTKIRARIQQQGGALYASLPAPLRHLAGELMQGNEELVLNQAMNGNGLTIGVESILNTGFTTNQVDIIECQRAQLNEISKSFEEAHSEAERLKEINLMVGALDGKTKLRQHQIQIDTYEDCVKDFCKTCKKKPCKSECKLYYLYGWSKL